MSKNNPLKLYEIKTKQELNPVPVLHSLEIWTAKITDARKHLQSTNQVNDVFTETYYRVMQARCHIFPKCHIRQVKNSLLSMIKKEKKLALSDFSHNSKEDSFTSYLWKCPVLCQVLPVKGLQHFGTAEPLETILHVIVEPLQWLCLQQPDTETRDEYSCW